jgi:hypothetical protein
LVNRTATLRSWSIWVDLVALFPPDDARPSSGHRRLIAYYLLAAYAHEMSEARARKWDVTWAFTPKAIHAVSSLLMVHDRWAFAQAMERASGREQRTLPVPI